MDLTNKGFWIGTLVVVLTVVNVVAVATMVLEGCHTEPDEEPPVPEWAQEMEALRAELERARARAELAIERADSVALLRAETVRVLEREVQHHYHTGPDYAYLPPDALAARADSLHRGLRTRARRRTAGRWDLPRDTSARGGVRLVGGGAAQDGGPR